jgi:hypothetical protein
MEDFKFPNNKLLYYLNDNTNENKFINSCKFGHLEIAKWLYSLGGINIHVFSEEAF